MNLRAIRNVLLLGLGLAACAPAIRPEYQMATDKALARYPASRHVYPALSRFRPPRWVVGEWVQYKAEGKDGPAVMRIAVVAHDARGWWIETENQDYRHHSISKVCYSRMPQTAEQAADDLEVIVTKVDDKGPQVTDFTKMQGPAAGFMKSVMKKTLQGVTVTIPAAATREDVTVPAGTFKGSWKFRSEADVAGFHTEATSLVHPDVYVNGLVKSATDDGKSSMELLAFGTGAVSALPNLP